VISVLTLRNSMVHIYVAPASQPISSIPSSIHLIFPHTQGTLLLPSLTSYITPPMQSHQPELHVKIVMVGNSSVGKSSLLMRWSENQWLPEDEASATIGVEVQVRHIGRVHSRLLLINFLEAET
jgi:hypothetical protein